MLALLTMACFTETALQRDQARYLAILSEATRPTGETLAACQVLLDDGLRSDCELYVATRGIGFDGPDAWCPAVSEVSIRSECWFAAAESWALRGQVETARGYCDSAGQYASGCRQHLFQIALREGAQSQASFSLRESEAAFVALMETWQVRITPSAEARLWEDWFVGIFQAQDRVENGQCAAVTAAHQQACRNAMRRARHRVNKN